MSTAQMQSNTIQTNSIAISKLLWAGPAAGLAAAVANLLVYFIATGLLSMPLNMPDFVTPTSVAPLQFIPVVVSSIVGGIGGAVVLAILSRFTARPVQIFQIVAAVFLLISFGAFLSLPAGVELSTKIVLAVMHTVAAATIVTVLPRLASNDR